MSAGIIVADAAHVGEFLERGTVAGHPAVASLDAHGNVQQMITCCAECGRMRTIIMLVGDRWYCSECRSEGHTRNVKMFPIS